MLKNINLTEDLEKYIIDHSEKLHPVQEELLKGNEKLGDMKKMQISIVQAYFLQFIIKTMNVKSILEIGTFTGFSSLSMGLSLPKDGRLVTIDKNEKTSVIAQIFFNKANLSKIITPILNQALDALHDLKKANNTFDLIFIDADKENYKIYYDKSLDLLKKNGLLIIDNVLWKGEVSDKTKEDKFTNIIRDFNNYIKYDKRVNQIILPLGDGLSICIKK